MKSLQLYGRNDMVNLYKQNKVYGSLGIEEQVKTIDKVVTGEQYVVLTECVEDKLKDITLFGKSEQLQTTGKNLFDKDSSVDGVLEIDGSIVISAGYSTSEYIAVEPNTKYTSTATGSKRLKFFDINKQPVQKNNFQDAIIETGGTFTTSDTTKYVRFSYINSAESSIMFNLGSSSSPYEPYTGRQPSPNPEYPQEIKNVGKWNEEKQKYEVDVQVTGKNLLDISACEDGKVLDVNGDISNNANALLTDFIQCFPKTPYCRSTRNFTVITFYDLKKNKIGFINQYDSCFTTPDKCRYFRFALNKTNADYKKTVVNVGKELAEYEPYREPQTIKLSLDQPLRGIGEHKDEVTKDGVARNFKELKFDGTEAWETWGANNTEEGHIGFFIYTKMLDKQNIFEKEIMCNMLKTVNSNYGGRGVGICLYIDERDRFNSYFSIALKNAMLEDVSTEEKAVQSFKKLLAQKKDEGKQFKLLARISHPIKEELPEECQKAIEKLSTYDPTTVITVDGGEVKAGISVTYKSYGNNIRSETNV